MEERIKKRILSDLSDSQKEIVLDHENNLYVTACPGSGKTRTLTRKIAYTSNLYTDSLKKIVAITYTNRAANEINDRLEKLEVNEDHIWIGTIHQFCLDFILRKFGLKCSRISRGIKIIDEYTTSKYLRIGCAELGMTYNPYDHPNLTLTTKGKGLENNPEKLKLVYNYHARLKKNNEIDFGLILTLSLKILQKSPIVSKIIASNIRSIFIDEFQDTNEFQYQILGLLSQTDPAIKLMFVGDSDQAIFTSLGGLVKSKREIEKMTDTLFIEKKLGGCYRSTQRIVDFYSQFQQQKYPIISLSDQRFNRGVVKYIDDVYEYELSSHISKIIKNSLENGFSENQICVIAPNQYILSPVAKQLKLLLPDSNFRSQDVYPIKPDDLNIFYKISFLVFTPIGKKMRLRKKIANEIIQSLKGDFNVNVNSEFISIDFLDLLNSVKPSATTGLEYLQEKIICIFNKLEITELNNLELFKQMKDFFEKAEERLTNPRLALSNDIESFKNVYKEESGINISTIHKVKGEEYDVVIAFGFVEDIVPHFKSKDPVTESKKLLYVAISRAKINVYIFSEKGRVSGNYPPKPPTPVLRDADIP